MTDTYTPVLTRDEIAAQWYAPLMADDTEAFARRIERAAIEAYQRQQWRPIETAPRDGRAIWAFNGENGVMRWTEGQDWALWIWGDELICDADPSPEQPTHWQPLPPPPEQS